jgi:predicted small lipoprotein YifL
MPSDIMMYATAAARKECERRSGLDVERKRAAFRPVQRKDFRKPSSARKQKSHNTRQKTLKNYKENAEVTRSRPCTRFDGVIHKESVTKNVEVKRLNYAAVDRRAKSAKVTPFQKNALRSRSRFSEVGTFINNAVEQKTNADFIVSHKSMIDNTKGAIVLPEGRGLDVNCYVVDQAGCGTDGPAILGPAEFKAEDGATIVPQGKHSRQSDIGSYVTEQAGCGTDGPAILGPAEIKADEGATIMPDGKHSRQSDIGSYVTEQAGCGTDGPAILGPAEFNVEDGATIMPEGKHSRQSDIGSYVTEQAGCGTHGPAILGPTLITTSGAKIMKEGRHSRFSDVGSHITAATGCGPRNAWVDKHAARRKAKIVCANAQLKMDQDAEVRARADTVEQQNKVVAMKTLCPYRFPTAVQHTRTSASQQKQKRFTWKNVKRAGWAIKMAFAPKFKTQDFSIQF